MFINKLNRNEEKGHGLTKYALMLAAAAIVVIVSLALMGPAINNALCADSQSSGGACEETAPENPQQAPQLRSFEEVSQDCMNKGGSYEISYTNTYGIYDLQCSVGPAVAFREDFR